MIKLPARYEKKAEPVSGGFGTAVLCTDRHLQRDVIVKWITQSCDHTKLLDEIHALQRIKSKHIVQIYDIIEDESGNQVGLVEEFLPGDDLMGFNAHDKGMSSYLSVLCQVSRGISDMHSCGIVHRDIKPNNMKYDSEGVVKIFDLNLAKHCNLPATTIGVKGTPGFMAPELFSYPPIIDKHADCYAFGCLAFYFANGSLPQCVDTRTTPRELKSDEGIENLLTINAKISSIINSCLNTMPNTRPSSEEIVGAFENELLYGKHRALLINKGTPYRLEGVGSKVRTRRASVDSVTIGYNGYSFVASDVIGDVYVNNRRIYDDFTLNGSSVIVLGAPELKWDRKFITFDVSHPEVIL